MFPSLDLQLFNRDQVLARTRILCELRHAPAPIVSPGEVTLVNHDQNFKNLILDYPRQALHFFAAEEAGGIDQATRILPVRQEQLQERLGVCFKHTTPMRYKP